MKNKLYTLLISTIMCMFSAVSASAAGGNTSVASGDPRDVFLIVGILAAAAVIVVVDIILGKKNNK